MGRGTEFFDYLNRDKDTEVAYRYSFINVTLPLREFKKNFKLSAKKAEKQKTVQAVPIQAESIQLELF